MRVAYLTASCMLPGSPDERSDSFEHAHEMRLLRPACEARGIAFEDAVWDDPRLLDADYDAYVVGTTWDYAERVTSFLARLAELEAAGPLFNPLATMRWNLDKRYLRELEAQGVPCVPTHWVERVDADAVAQAAAKLGDHRLVAKPQVGANAWRQARLDAREPLPPAGELPPGAAMLQPFLPAAQSEGEFSFVFFDRSFSHCAQKIPASGDYRVQSYYGAREHTHTPSAADLAVAQAAVDAVAGPLLYARVDLMRLPSGQLALMELELVEPYLYPEQGPEMGPRFADALLRMMAQV